MNAVMEYLNHLYEKGREMEARCQDGSSFEFADIARFASTVRMDAEQLLSIWKSQERPGLEDHEWASVGGALLDKAQAILARTNVKMERIDVLRERFGEVIHLVNIASKLTEMASERAGSPSDEEEEDDPPSDPDPLWHPKESGPS